MLAILYTALLAVAVASPLPQEHAASPIRLPKVFIHPNGNRDKCIDIAGDVEPGTALQISDCTGSKSQQFSLSRGSAQITVPDTLLCITPGQNNGDAVTLQRCNRSMGQVWRYTEDDTIVGPGGFCIDLTDGKLANGTPVQVWACNKGNPNQMWTNTPVAVPY